MQYIENLDKMATSTALDIRDCIEYNYYYSLYSFSSGFISMAVILLVVFYFNRIKK